jgi:DNA-binding response OmpR family regulator
MRIFLAEDEFLVGLVLEEDLRAAGFSIVGPFTTFAAALAASRSEEFDLAVLDINMAGEMIFPLADELQQRGIPYIFLSGYASMDLPERFRSLPRFAKPHDPVMLVRQVEQLLPKRI